MDIYLDDLTVSEQGSFRHVKKEVVRAAAMVEEGVKAELGGEVATEKTGLAATSNKKN